MKKFFFILFIFTIMAFTANAQQDVCRVSGGNGASVQITVVSWTESTVTVSIGSDCDDYVNVSFTFDYRASFNEVNGRATAISDFSSQKFGETVPPRQSNNYTYTIRLPFKDAKIENVTSVNISGARCE